MDLDSERNDARYLGDGVYAQYDGYQVWLYTDRENGRHVIALEPQVYLELKQFFESKEPRVK